jgi:hypothetical protein
MKIDFANDVMLSEHLEESKSNLFIYFHDNYTHAAISTPPSMASPSAQTSPIMGSPQKSFTARSILSACGHKLRSSRRA